MRTNLAKSFPISAASRLTGIEVHTLRYWESEFSDFLAPERTAGGQRRYSHEDLKTVLVIRKLLQEDKFSIAGARQYLSRFQQSAAA